MDFIIKIVKWVRDTVVVFVMGETHFAEHTSQVAPTPEIQKKESKKSNLKNIIAPKRKIRKSHNNQMFLEPSQLSGEKN